MTDLDLCKQQVNRLRYENENLRCRLKQQNDVIGDQYTTILHLENQLREYQEMDKAKRI